MRIKTSELTGATLDWAVAKCEFPSHVLNFRKGSSFAGTLELYTKSRFAWVRGRYERCTLADAEHLLEIETDSYYCPSTSWGIGGPIIEREGILLRAIRRPRHSMDGQWLSMYDGGNSGSRVYWGKRKGWPESYLIGPTPLIAAMRCYVAGKLGDEVDVPEELA